MLNNLKFAFLFTVLSFPLSANAQSTNLLDSFEGREFRTSVGITIPFGGNKQSSKPRMELMMQQLNSKKNVIQSNNLFNNRVVTYDTRIGLLLADQPQLMLNGRAFEPRNNNQNLSSTATVLLIGGSVLAGVIAVAIVSDDVSDSIDRALD